MRNLKRLSALTGLALAVVAFTAPSASADIVIPGKNDPYVGPIAGVNTGLDPRFEAGGQTITCEGAAFAGTMDGTAPATGELDFSWDQCTTSGPTGCTVDDIEDVPVAFDESPPAPDFFIINTEAVETFISCALLFNCTVSADSSEVEAYVVGGTDPVASIDAAVNYTGPTCPEWPGRMVAEYEVTVPEEGLESND